MGQKTAAKVDKKKSCKQKIKYLAIKRHISKMKELKRILNYKTNLQDKDDIFVAQRERGEWEGIENSSVEYKI